MLLSEVIKDQLLTDSQLRCKITASVKAWLKVNDYDKVIFFRCIRGTYHFDNCQNYMLSAKYILETATGLPFTYMDGSMARLQK